MKIAYIISDYPSPMETFVKAEVEEWPPDKYQVSIFSIKPRKKSDRMEGVWYNTFNVFILLRSVLKNLLSGKSLLFDPVIIKGVASGIAGKPGQFLQWFYLYLSLDHIQEALKAENPDYILSHFLFRGTFVASSVAESLSIPCHLRIHTNYSSLSLKEQVRIVKTARTLSAISSHAADFVSNTFHRKDVVIIRQSLLPQVFEQGLREGLGDTIKLIAAGRFIPKKGFDDLIRSLKELSPQHLRQVSLRIFGEGKLKAEYEKLIEKFGLGKRVALCEPVDHKQLMKEFSNSDLLIVPSRKSDADIDGIPTVIPEAMLLGVPVVARAVAGIPELIIQDQTGFLVLDEKTSSLASQIDYAIQSREAWSQISKNARLKVLNEYDLNLSQSFADIIKNGQTDKF